MLIESYADNAQILYYIMMNTRFLTVWTSIAGSPSESGHTLRKLC